MNKEGRYIVLPLNITNFYISFKQNSFKISDDYVTKNLIQEFIIEENEHLEWVRKSLKLIETIGLENYILE